MPNFNKTFLMGHLTRDPELRHTASGTAVAIFGLAINRTWTVEGEKKEETCYVDINMFGRRAEVINEYFTKGNPIFIEGRLQFNQWETRDGQKRNALRVVAEDFQFVGGKAEKKGNSRNAKPGDDDIDEEDIPF